MNKLIDISKPEDIINKYKDTPVGLLLEYHNLNRSLDDTYENAKEKVLATISRAKDNIKRRNDLENCWFGPIHGARYSDLLELSTNEMSKLDFGVLAIGGLVKFFLNYFFYRI